MNASQIGSGSMSDTASGPPVRAIVRAALLVLGLAEIRQHVVVLQPTLPSWRQRSKSSPVRECRAAR
jgi:hypothetical protein